MFPSAHVDTFTRDNLPPAGQWPTLLLDRPELRYPERLNAAVALVDGLIADVGSGPGEWLPLFDAHIAAGALKS